MSIIGGILAGVASGAVNALSAHNTNMNNVDSYKHRYQWAVDDMKKAGINPILAAGGSSAAGSAPVYMNPTAEALKSASNMMSNANEYSKTDIQRELADASVAKANEDVANAKETNNLIKAQVAKTSADTAVSLNNATRINMENDAYDSKLGIMDKGYNILEHLFDNFSKPVTKALDLYESGGGNKSSSTDSHVSQNGDVVFADEMPHLWDRDYKSRRKTYDYIQSLRKK